MANSTDNSGVKVFSNAVWEALEDQMNQFLNGDDSQDIPRKQFVFPPTVFLSGGLFYAMVVYRAN